MQEQPTATELRETLVFSRWLADLRDAKARVRIQARLLRVRQGNLGDVKPVGEGVLELRIDYGPGYRIYCVRQGASIIVLLTGGDKNRLRLQACKNVARASKLQLPYAAHGKQSFQGRVPNLEVGNEPKACIPIPPHFRRAT